MPTLQEQLTIMFSKYKDRVDIGDFAKTHILRSTSEQCWICLLPIGNGHYPDDLKRSRDHLIPQSKGGIGKDGNIKYAHRYCNSKRGNRNLTQEMVDRFRMDLFTKHPKWIGLKLSK